MKKKEQKAQQERRHHEAAPWVTAEMTPEEVEETGLVGVKAGSSGFVLAQLYTMSHHLEVAQHAVVQRGPETLTLLVLRPTYAAMAFQPPIPRGYEDGWLQTVAGGLGRALGFSEPPVPMPPPPPPCPWPAHFCTAPPTPSGPYLLVCMDTSTSGGASFTTKLPETTPARLGLPPLQPSTAAQGFYS